MELKNESIRKHQINDEGLAEILRLKENNSNKPAINSVSGLGLGLGLLNFRQDE